MQVVAIIQARMSSSRLPGKVLADVCGKPMLWYVVTRAQQAARLDLVVVATSNEPSDDAIEKFCELNRIACFRGSKDDVLDRYYRAANRFRADVIVRLTADCPLLDAAVVDKVVQTFLTGGYDYVSSNATYPDGLDTEVFSRRALARAWQEARLPSEREHVTPYINKHSTRFRLGSVTYHEDLSSMRWTVDEPEDLELVRRIYDYLAGKASFGMNDVLGLFRDHPELKMINVGFKRNEGYAESVKEDKLEVKRNQ
jgi:spore coat polysaccharide biosynthesis protein SpsF